MDRSSAQQCQVMRPVQKKSSVDCCRDKSTADRVPKSWMKGHVAVQISFASLLDSFTDTTRCSHTGAASHSHIFQPYPASASSRDNDSDIWGHGVKRLAPVDEYGVLLQPDATNANVELQLHQFRAPGMEITWPCRTIWATPEDGRANASGVGHALQMQRRQRQQWGRRWRRRGLEGAHQGCAA